MDKIQDKQNMNSHLLESKQDGSLFQRVEEVFKRLGMNPKWDYSRAGQTVIMPISKEMLKRMKAGRDKDKDSTPEGKAGAQ